MIREERTFVTEEVTETVVIGKKERDLTDTEIEQLLDSIGVSNADIASLSEESKRNIVSQHKIVEKETEDREFIKVDVEVGWQDENKLAKGIKTHIFAKHLGEDTKIVIRGGMADFEHAGFVPTVWFNVTPEQFDAIKEPLSEYLKLVSPEFLD